jgi:RHS repeat-associated protein
VLVKQWLYRDQLNPVAELDGAGNLVAQFVYGSRGHVPDFMVRDGEVYRIVSDQVGSVRLVVNAGDVSDVLFRAEYTAFGEMTVLEGDVEATPFGFAGGLFDAETGLTRFGARDYDPVVGRWTAKDPIRFNSGDAPNFYLYANGNPVSFVDPGGLQSMSSCVNACVAEFRECFAREGGDQDAHSRCTRRIGPPGRSQPGVPGRSAVARCAVRCGELEPDGRELDPNKDPICGAEDVR